MGSKEFRQLIKDFRKGAAVYQGAVVKQIFTTGTIMIETPDGGIKFIDLTK